MQPKIKPNNELLRSITHAHHTICTPQYTKKHTHTHGYGTSRTHKDTHKYNKTKPIIKHKYTTKLVFWTAIKTFNMPTAKSTH